MPSLTKMARRVSQLYENGTFANFFGNDVVLIPVPGSTPRRDTSTSWVPEKICNVLNKEGLANSIMCNARRVCAVPKSAYQEPGSRPDAKMHYDSIAVLPELIPPTRILLVDDIVTKGNTVLGCAARVHETFPKAEIKAFAVIRTMGLRPDIDQVSEPCVGCISLDGNEACRDP